MLYLNKNDLSAIMASFTGWRLLRYHLKMMATADNGKHRFWNILYATA